MVEISEQRFEELVEEALESIPDRLWSAIDNVAVVIQDWPRPSQLAAVGIAHPASLLGLYEGVPLTKRTRGYGLVPPDRITIFRKPILQMCRTSDEHKIRAQIRRTVLHEIAHHFGISDERLRELGAY